MLAQNKFQILTGNDEGANLASANIHRATEKSDKLQAIDRAVARRKILQPFADVRIAEKGAAAPRARDDVGLVDMMHQIFLEREETQSLHWLW